MKRFVSLALGFLLCLTLLSGCSRVKAAIRALIDDGETTSPVETTTPRPKRTRSADTTAAPAETEPAATAAPGSASGDREDLSDDELIEFFRQVVFGGKSSEVAYKRMDPIVVLLTGSYSQQDEEFLTGLFDTFNQYDDFPEIIFQQAAGADANVNMQVRFVTESELKTELPEWNGEQPLYATFDDDDYEIYNGTVYLVSDWVESQQERNYLLSWGVFYSFGFTFDSGMFTDSLFHPDYFDYQSSSSFTRPVAADWYLVSMLYSPAVKPGMTMEEAVAALGN